MEKEAIIYEQSLNEHIRVCLRLEHLFAQAQYYLDKQSCWDSRTALATIIEIIDVIDRPDIKSKLTNALHLYSSALTHLQHSPAVNKKTLQHTLEQLDQSRNILHNIQGKLGQDLRDNEFLTAIRQRINTAGGTCKSAIPAYFLWLQQPLEQRYKTLQTWYSSFEQLEIITKLLLQLTRESSTPISQRAQNGFYQEALAADISYQMIRVIIPNNIHVYPEISVGKYRLSIYFFDLHIDDHATQTTDDISFDLTCCKM